jgi:DNA-binding CsgD family transcriptional regulator
MKHFATEDGIDFVSQVVPASRRLAMEKHPRNYTRGAAMMITGHTSAAVTRRPEFREHTLSHSPDETAMRVDLPPGSLKNKIPAREANESLTRNKMPPSRSVAGLLLMDSSLNPISFNAEAIQILGYPEKLAKIRHMDVLLGEKVRSTLLSGQRLGDTPFVTEFRSGRRHYFCRAFLVDAPSKGPSHPSIAVLLERGPSGLIRLSQVSRQFNLSQREGEALTYLLQGLSTKEIANRMNVSSNTVKVFLRLIMIKTGVSCRSAVVGKIMMTQP